jgi:FKBP-type peptidyl-prolyl cis-trans isomerase 2
MRIPYPHTAIGLVVILVCSALSVEQSWSAASRFSATFSSPEMEASRIVDGSKVMLAYHVTVLGEKEIDYDDVSEFVQGRHEIFRALEQKVAGMRAGEAKKVELTPEEGFGARDESKKMKIPKTDLPTDAQAGDVVQNEEGSFATVAGVSESEAVLDYNHPLAGRPLAVSLRIVKVTNP